MKKITYIFLIYILINAAVPCFIYAQCCDESDEVQIVLVSAGSEECNDCSPLFNCNDCIKHFLTNKLNLAPVQHSPEKYYPIIFVQNICFYTPGIWQPPKIQ